MCIKSLPQAIFTILSLPQLLPTNKHPSFSHFYHLQCYPLLTLSHSYYSLLYHFTFILQLPEWNMHPVEMFDIPLKSSSYKLFWLNLLSTGSTSITLFYHPTTLYLLQVASIQSLSLRFFSIVSSIKLSSNSKIHVSGGRRNV